VDEGGRFVKKMFKTRLRVQRDIIHSMLLTNLNILIDEWKLFKYLIKLHKFIIPLRLAFLFLDLKDKIEFQETGAFRDAIFRERNSFAEHGNLY
jgi:hypothetical protein